MLFMFLLGRHMENVTGKSSWLQCRSLLEMFLKILFISRVKWGIQLQYVYQTLEYSAWVISLYIYSIWAYTVLGFTVPFEYFYCKKDSGFEIVENKCIFVHQSFILGWVFSLLMIFFHLPYPSDMAAVQVRSHLPNRQGNARWNIYTSFVYESLGGLTFGDLNRAYLLCWGISGCEVLLVCSVRELQNFTWHTLKHSVPIYPFCQPVYLCHVQHQGLRDTSSCIGSHY